MSNPPPIVNGTPTNGDFSSVGTLIVDYGNSSHLICTGTLVYENIVITAGHCSQQIDALLSDALPVYFIFDENIDIQNMDYTNEILVSHTIVHPLIDVNLNHDISLVFLEQSTDIVPSNMSLSVPDLTWQNIPFTFVGSGNTSELGNDEGVKRIAEIPYYDNDDMFHYAIDLSGTTTTNLCYGDSGGPMFRRNDDDSFHLIGVNSFVFSITDEDLPCTQGGTGSIRIDQYAQWIAEEMNVDFDCIFDEDRTASDDCSLNDNHDSEECKDDDCHEYLDTVQEDIPQTGCQQTPSLLESGIGISILILCIRNRCVL